MNEPTFVSSDNQSSVLADIRRDVDAIKQLLLATPTSEDLRALADANDRVATGSIRLVAAITEHDKTIQKLIQEAHRHNNAAAEGDEWKATDADPESEADDS